MTRCCLACLLIALVLGCVACGQKGKLYLPDDTANSGVTVLALKAE